MKESASPGLPVSALGFPTMPRTSSNFDFRRPVSYDDKAKRVFHSRALRQLKLLANALGLAPGGYALSSNPGGIAVSGEATRHGDHVYGQACQAVTRPATWGLVRACERPN